jgi:hypothetical protein
MPALVAGIHVFADRKLEEVDGRDKRAMMPFSQDSGREDQPNCRICGRASACGVACGTAE